MARRPVRPGPPLPRPEVQPEDPGSWLVDLSHIELDPRLPSAFNPDGTRPIGPAWYQTHTVAYAQELGYDVRPIEAYLRRETGAYLDPWHDCLKTAYVDTLADLGVTRDLSDEEFLAAMERHKDVAPALTAVLAAIKATVKGGGGKLRERPQGRHYKPARKPPVLPASRSRPALVSAAPHRSAPPTTDASAASPCTSPRHTHSACSTPATRERPTSRWAKSSPRDSKRWRHRHRPSLRSPHILDARPTRATTPPTP